MHYVLALLMIFVLLAPDSHAGKLSRDSQLMLKGSELMAKEQPAQAISYYNAVIQSDPNHINAYLQRAFAYREMKRLKWVQHDATMVVRLANHYLQSDSNNKRLYYQRGNAYRLLKQFDHARRDINIALRLGGKQSWRQDLTAIAIEERMAGK